MPREKLKMHKRKEKKRVPKKKSKTRAIKRKSGEWAISLVMIIGIGSFIGLMFWAQFVARPEIQNPPLISFELICDINQWDFDVNTTLVDETREIIIENDPDVESYPTATIEIIRSAGINNEWYDIVNGTWVTSHKYNIFSINRGEFTQSISAYLRDYIVIDIKQFVLDDPYTATLKQHYTLSGTVGGASYVSRYETNTWTGTYGVQGIVAKTLETISKISPKD